MMVNNFVTVNSKQCKCENNSIFESLQVLSGQTTCLHFRDGVKNKNYGIVELHIHNKKNEMNRALGHLCAHIG